MAILPNDNSFDPGVLPRKHPSRKLARVASERVDMLAWATVELGLPVGLSLCTTFCASTSYHIC